MNNIEKIKRTLKTNNSFLEFLKNKRVIFICLIFIICVIFISALCFQCSYQQDENDTSDDNLFPVDITLNKNIAKQKVNQLVQECAAGKSNYTNVLSNQAAILNKKTNSAKLESFGDAKPEKNKLDDLNKAIQDFKNLYDTKIHILMFDLNSNSGISFDADAEIPSASTIKLPYIVSMLENNPELFDEEYNQITNCLTWSDNESYLNLYSCYGNQNLKNGCAQLGITNTMGDIEFPETISTRDMSLLGLKCFYYLHTTDIGPQICSLLEKTSNSFFQTLLSNKYTVHSKPGGGDCGTEDMAGKYYNGLRADCGVIHAGDNPYILIIFCEDYIDDASLQNLIEKIDQAHLSMYTKQVTCYNQEELDAANEQNVD